MDTATLAAGFATVIAAINLIWSIRSLTKIQRDVERSNRLHDQTVQRLYRAREAVITVHKTFMRTLYYIASGLKADDGFRTAHIDWSSSVAELKGISDAVGNEELTDLVKTFIKYAPDEKDPAASEAVIMSFSAKLHTVITNLLVDATKS